jgi:GT2 family glycosyltransferase
MSIREELLSIIIVNYNTRDLLRRCLQSLDDHRASIPQEVIVVDNQSTDGSADMVEAAFPEVRLVRSQSNDGYGSAINATVPEARGSWLLFLNPDIEVGGEALDMLLEFARTHPRAGVVGPRLVYGNGKVQPSARGSMSPGLLLAEALRLHLLLPRSWRSRLYLGTYFDQDRTLDVPWVSGAAFLIPRRVWDEVGPLTEETFCGSDDYDYCYRARRCGYQVWLCSEATMTHHCSVAVRKRWTTWQVDQVAIHNFFVVYESHGPAWKVRALALVEIIVCATEGLRHLIRPRAGQDSPGESYGYRLRKRAGLMFGFLTGLKKPIRRFQPRGRSETPPQSGVTPSRATTA